MTDQTPASALTNRRVVLDLVPGHPSAPDSSSALYARADDDRPGAIALPLIYLTPADFRALGEREQITITIEPGDLLNDDEDRMVTCPNCGRDHIPDEHEGAQHDTCVECLDGRGDDQ